MTHVNDRDRDREWPAAGRTTSPSHPPPQRTDKKTNVQADSRVFPKVTLRIDQSAAGSRPVPPWQTRSSHTQEGAASRTSRKSQKAPRTCLGAGPRTVPSPRPSASLSRKGAGGREGLWGPLRPTWEGSVSICLAASTRFRDGLQAGPVPSRGQCLGQPHS